VDRLPCPPDSGHSRIRFFQAELPSLSRELEHLSFDYIVSQRMLHYLRFAEARRLLEWCLFHLTADGMLFLGVSGIGSELGIGYGGVGEPLERRWHVLRGDHAIKHAIAKPVCLYSLAELCEFLQRTGFAIDDSWVSDFGNLKIVARRDEPPD
jgi:hypothetical protein